METVANLREAPHWSYTALNTYLQCPRKYAFRYVEHAPVERLGACFPFGRAFHAALSERARNGRNMSEREVCNVFEDFFKVETEAAENLVYKPSETYDTLLQTGFKMVETACRNWQDDFAVKSVAESFSVSVPGLAKPLIGEFDCVVTDGRDTCIVDWKTASAKWPQGKADRDLQATAFCYAFKEKYGEKPLFRFDVVTKTKTPTVSSYYTVREEEDFARFAALANHIETSVANGSFYPNESGFGCMECPYRERCRKWPYPPRTKCLNHSGSTAECS